MNDVQNFIKRFHSYDSIDDVFTNGCCYWFAAILFGRFIRDGAEMVYDQVANHFGTRIRGRVYDITGDVTEMYRWESWYEIDDEILRKRVLRDCVMF
ncbi:MAG: hypothetical protein J6Y20_07735 [Lachnospiraceae bacterium]|nr:hypothetical protein [Lachnospiraceae bacterium]